jgi:hypothetical protein
MAIAPVAPLHRNDKFKLFGSLNLDLSFFFQRHQVYDNFGFSDDLQKNMDLFIFHQSGEL